jgi:hypothetical protein
VKKYIDNQIKWLKRYSDAEIKSIRETSDKVKDQTSKFVTRSELLTAVVAVIIILTWLMSLLNPNPIN